MTFQLPSTDEKADYVLKQFDRIAERYDLANDLISLGMHRLWKRKAIAELLSGAELQGSAAAAAESPATGADRADIQLKTESKAYLDVCTGTGDLALLLAGKVNASPGKVVGLDFSSQMLAVAKQRLSHARQTLPLSFIQGDAQNLPFADNSFDGAIISFGLRNLSDLPAGLKEMARVVKPGGKVVNLDLGQPDMPVFTPLFLFFFHHVVPLIGEIIQQDRTAYTYLPESRKNYPHPLRLSQMFAEAGMRDVKWSKLACGSVALHVGIVR